MLLNFLVMTAKLVIGYLTGSLSIVADGYDSLFDGAGNIIGLVGLYIAARPADRDHPYGHRKFETLAAVTISILLFVTCIEITRNALDRLRNPIVPEINVWSFAALAFSIAVHLYVTIYEHRKGKALKSEILVADALHTRADIYVSVGVMAGLIVIRQGYPIIDVVLALVIVVLIAKIGLDIIRESAKVLADAAILDSAQVAHLALQVPGVQGCHHVRSRGQEDDIHLDLHIQVAPDLPINQAHHIAHAVQQHLSEQLEGVRDIIIHVEPQTSTSTPFTEEIIAQARTIARQMQADIHSVRAHEIAGRYYLDMHLEAGKDASLEQAHKWADNLERAILEKMPHVAKVTIHIEPAEEENMAHDEESTHQQASTISRAIEALATKYPHLTGYHDLTIHTVAEKILVTLHCSCAGDIPVDEAHAISSEIESLVRELVPDADYVTVHMEPTEH